MEVDEPCKKEIVKTDAETCEREGKEEKEEDKGKKEVNEF